MKEKTGILLVILLAFSVSLTGQDYPLAPDFQLKDLDGRDLTLQAYKGQVVFVNFWATWCPPCRQEIPGFIEIYEKYKDQGMTILGISLDRADEEVIREFVSEYKITYPVAKGSFKLALEYGSGQAVPETFVIDRQGRIRHKHLGFMDKDTLETLYKELASEK